MLPKMTKTKKNTLTTPVSLSLFSFAFCHQCMLFIYTNAYNVNHFMYISYYTEWKWCCRAADYFQRELEKLILGGFLNFKDGFEDIESMQVILHTNNFSFTSMFWNLKFVIVALVKFQSIIHKKTKLIAFSENIVCWCSRAVVNSFL